jgi:SAM-dependent methyltransferase
MPERVDLFNITYSKFTEEVLGKVRRETFGDDIGQNSWTLKKEYETFLRDLQLTKGKRLLDIACGAGGPALFTARTTGCNVIGIDKNLQGIETARELAQEHGLENQVDFQVVDASKKLPFESGSFDAIICIDSFIHFANRLEVFRDWSRLLRHHGRVLFTDSVVITGLVTDDEIATRSSIGKFFFSPPGLDEQLLRDANLKPLRTENSTSTMEQVAREWHASRFRHEEALVKLEGRERFEGLQKFFDCVRQLAKNNRLSRFTILAERN